MAIATPAAGAKETVRQKRERDQELLVWPDLVFVEFICAVLFTITFVILSVVVNAPLLDKANSNITPNPSKAPWYLMNLQELLLHMDKGLAGVTVPTVALLVLAAIPYTDRSNDGQGTWFGTANAIRITIFSAVYSGLVIPLCILWDDGAHVRVFAELPRTLHLSDHKWKWLGDRHPFEWLPGQLGNFTQHVWELAFLKNRVALRDEWHWSLPVPRSLQLGGSGHDGSLDWPQDLAQIPIPLNGTWIWHWDQPSWMPGWMLHLYWYNSDISIPAITAEFVMPIATILVSMIILLVALRKLGWLHTVRDAWIAIFTGFIMVYLSLTIVGAAFRGRGQQLVPTPKVPNLENDPSIRREVPQPSAPYGLVDVRNGTHA
ncbi:MAG: hypothetical protein M3P30_00765 [Chloroflexota bacterium]|nr:hypothetical protein [Chloroflexota bacterium]